MPLPATPSGAERVLMRDEAYSRLRGLIVDGALAPAERLRDTEIASWLGVSRTPVREALARLVDDGLVEMAANRFTRVSGLRARDAIELYPVLGQLEPLIGAELAAAPPRTLVDTLTETADRFTWSVWREDDVEAIIAEADFHAALRDASGNGQLRALLERLGPRLRRLEQRAWPQIGQRWPAHRHAALLEALATRSSSGAAEALAGEWREVGSLVAGALAEAGVE
jgi:DNA-binding GntR family transcriptional regulator